MVELRQQCRRKSFHFVFSQGEFFLCNPFVLVGFANGGTLEDTHGRLSLEKDGL